MKHRRARAASLLQHHESCANVDDPAGQVASVVTDHTLELEHVSLFSQKNQKKRLYVIIDILYASRRAARRDF